MLKKLLFLIVLGYCCNAAAQDVWDLKRSVEYAIANNISVKQADLQSRFSKLDLDRNRLGQLPDANFQANSGYRFGRSENPSTGVLEDANFFTSGYRLQTSATLFNWFSKKYTISSSEFAYEADKAQVRKVQDDIALNVAVGYLQVLLAKEQVGLVTIQVEQTKSQLELTRKKVRAGALPELSAAELEAQLASDSSNLISSQQNVQQLLLQLKAILNLDAAAPFDIVTPPIDLIPVEPLADMQPAYVYGLALKNLSQQLVNNLRLESYREATKAAKGAMYPTLSAYGGLGTNYVNIATPQSIIPVDPKPTSAFVNVGGTDYVVLAPGVNVVTGVTPYGRQLRNNFAQDYGLALNVPIFNGAGLRTNYKRSQLFVKQAELDVEAGNQKLKQDIYTAYNDAVAAMQKYNANRKMVEAAQKAFDFTKKRYDLNLVSTYELINSQNNLLRAKVEMVSAQYDYVFRMKLLEFYKGQGLKL